ncbi:acetate/propionate family kinase [Mucilaginibacter sp. L3T2-6]|uniref:acetate/propionate family kinase n=1 Tax=Mucilaginibacter sp. L3T2-6 TaxID=3062491 RepID=UPI0026744E1D|nr:acetate/propionate family kinase [Mucilaginibacter sp. L3T2-6]MDO3645252.1 acetate/propionate family kinase [Mucilaginibacter sp. L3T2-6]MDV6217704.1 acetate/propionate family kinase [Mucilaginibacter sp. L3T2-6]
MPATGNVVLAINAGSSSVKFALYQLVEQEETLLFSGSSAAIPAHEELADWLKKQPGIEQLTVIGHRVVHGMNHIQPETITPALVAELKTYIPYDPEHLPAEIRLIELFLASFPHIRQVACFDTMFHQTMPAMATIMAIPEKYRQKGVRRYGFHGLSYQYLTEYLATNDSTHENVVIAHLGSGASVAAIQNGKSIDTSMGFTPGAGLVMSTRCGDLDPGVAAYLFRQVESDSKQFNHLVNHKSGLLAVSGTSSDMKELVKVREEDNRAAEAINLFCYQVSKYIGAYAAAMGGIDTLVFSGGIGEHLPEVRGQICRKLGFLGIELDSRQNLTNAENISTGKTRVYVIPTNEALMMARLITRVIPNDIK